jgi:hypothetical protein
MHHFSSLERDDAATDGAAKSIEKTAIIALIPKSFAAGSNLKADLGRDTRPSTKQKLSE